MNVDQPLVHLSDLSLAAALVSGSQYNEHTVLT